MHWRISRGFPLTRERASAKDPYPLAPEAPEDPVSSITKKITFGAPGSARPGTGENQLVRDFCGLSALPAEAMAEVLRLLLI
jgi:hypothetical protein